jgi:UDP-glucose 4-epimerase
MSDRTADDSVLVTGGAGYIGSVIVERLLGEGAKVVVLDDLRKGHREAVLPGAVFIEGNLGDRALLDDVLARHRVGAVIHMAAESIVPISMTDPGLFFRENLANGIALLDAMAARGVRRLVFSSTAAVYGNPQRVPILEDDPKAPINAYGESKLGFERALPWYGQAHGIQAISLRYFNAAGASRALGEDHRPETHLIPLVLQVPLGQRAGVAIFGDDYATPDGTCIRDYVHVVDMADAHIAALHEVEQHGGRAYNLGIGRGFSVKEIIEAARLVTGHPIPARVEPRRPGDPAVLLADASRARSELGWTPAWTDPVEIVRSAWEWHRAHPEGYRS